MKVKPPPSSIPQSPVRLLIIDNDESLSMCLLEHFHFTHYATTTVGNAETALRYLSQSPGYDIALLEVRLPDKSGFDLLIETQQLPIDTSFLIISAQASLEDRLRGFDLGVADYIMKPFEMEELEARVESVLRSRLAPASNGSCPERKRTGSPGRFSASRPPTMGIRTGGCDLKMDFGWERKRPRSLPPPWQGSAKRRSAGRSTCCRGQAVPTRLPRSQPPEAGRPFSQSATKQHASCEVPAMSTDFRPRSSRASSSSRRIADVVYRSLKTAIKQQCTRRHAEGVKLRRLNRTSANRLMRLQLGCRDLVQMAVRVTVTHAGDNVYDIVCKIEDGPSRRISFGLPAGAGTALSRAPCLGQKLGHFLLGELEQRLGRRSLPTDEPTATA